MVAFRSSACSSVFQDDGACPFAEDYPIAVQIKGARRSWGGIVRFESTPDAQTTPNANGLSKASALPTTMTVARLRQICI